MRKRNFVTGLKERENSIVKKLIVKKTRNERITIEQVVEFVVKLKPIFCTLNCHTTKNGRLGIWD